MQLHVFCYCLKLLFKFETAVCYNYDEIFASIPKFNYCIKNGLIA